MCSGVMGDNDHIHTTGLEGADLVCCGVMGDDHNTLYVFLKTIIKNFENFHPREMINTGDYRCALI